LLQTPKKFFSNQCHYAIYRRLTTDQASKQNRDNGQSSQHFSTSTHTLSFLPVDYSHAASTPVLPRRPKE
jgi:hypothetical protein